MKLNKCKTWEDMFFKVCKKCTTATIIIIIPRLYNNEYYIGYYNLYGYNQSEI